MSGSVVWQVLGWLALVLNVVGNLQLTGKSRGGWIVRLLVNVLWIGYSVDQHAWALLANHAVFVPINVWGWARWRSEQADDEANVQRAYSAEVRRLRAELSALEVDCGLSLPGDGRVDRGWVVSRVRRALCD